MFSQFFCKKKQIRNNLFCKQCCKLINDHKEACSHKNEQVLIVDFEDKLLNVNSRLTQDGAFQVFDLIQSSYQNLQNLEELRMTFVGAYQPWMKYLPDPLSRNFKTWKGCNKKLKNLKKLVINLSETRLEDCLDIFFQGFEDMGEVELEELELDFFSILINTDQLIDILQKLQKFTTLKKLSLNIGKLGRINVTTELVEEFKQLFSQLNNLEYLSFNISSMTQTGDVRNIENIINSIELLPLLNQLKLSCKNCRLTSKSMPLIQQFLENMASKLYHLDLDISYNASLGQDMTKSIFTSLKQYKQLRQFSINLKGSDTHFNKDDYFIIQKFIYKIFKLSIQRYKSTHAIENCYIKGISVQLPLAFIRQNLQLCNQNNNLIQNMVKYGPSIYYSLLKTPQLSNSFRKDIIAEIYTQFLI